MLEQSVLAEPVCVFVSLTKTTVGFGQLSEAVIELNAGRPGTALHSAVVFAGTPFKVGGIASLVLTVLVVVVIQPFNVTINFTSLVEQVE